MEEQDRVAIFQQFGRTYRAFMSAFEAQVGHPIPRWRIMVVLDRFGGRSSQKRLVEMLRIDPGALTRQLKALEALGWVERESDARDNRVTNVRLTADGQAAFDAGVPHRNAFLRETMSVLPDAELNALASALAMLESRIADVGTQQIDTPADAN
jgi:DNA-binding MarR family transcriptional regulator